MASCVRSISNISVLDISLDKGSAINDEVVKIFTFIVYCSVCLAIDIFGMAANIINILCFVKQGFKESVNVSLLGMYNDGFRK